VHLVEDNMCVGESFEMSKTCVIETPEFDS